MNLESCCQEQTSNQSNIQFSDVFFLNKNINQQQQFYNNRHLNLQNEKYILLAIVLDFQMLFQLNKNQLNINEQIKNYLSQQFEFIKNNNISNLKQIINAEILTIIVIKHSENDSENEKKQEQFPKNDFMKLQSIFYDIYWSLQKQDDELFRIFLDYLIQNITEELCCFYRQNFNIDKSIFEKKKVNSKTIQFKPDEDQFSIKKEIINSAKNGNVKKAKELFQELNFCWTQDELQSIYEEIIQQYLIYLIVTFNDIKDDMKRNKRKGREQLQEEIKKSEEFDKFEINKKFQKQSMKEIIIEKSKNTLNKELSNLLYYNTQNFNKNLLETLKSYFELNNDLLKCNEQQQKQFQDYIQSKLQEGKNIQSKFIDYNQNSNIKLDYLTQNLSNFFQTIDTLLFFDNTDTQLMKQLGIIELAQQIKELQFTSLQQKQIKNYILEQQKKAENIKDELDIDVLSFDQIDIQLTEFLNIMNSLQVFCQLEKQMVYDQLKIDDQLIDQIKKLQSYKETVKLVIEKKINNSQYNIPELIVIKKNDSEVIQKIYTKFNLGQFDKQKIQNMIKEQFNTQYELIIEKIENKTLNQLVFDGRYNKQNFELDILKNIIDQNEIEQKQNQIIRKMREQMKTFKDEDKKVYIPQITSRQKQLPTFMKQVIDELQQFSQQ